MKINLKPKAGKDLFLFHKTKIAEKLSQARINFDFDVSVAIAKICF